MDISINSSLVLPTANTLTARSMVLSTSTLINAGQVVYADPISKQIGLAVATDAIKSTNVVGVALTTSAANQPIVFATAGDLTFNSNALTAATTYVLSAANPGGIAPTSDLVATNYGTILGIATGSASLRLDIVASGVQK